MKTQFVIRLRAFPDLYLSRRVTAGDIHADSYIQDYIKNHVDNLLRDKKPIPAHAELLKEALGMTWRWTRSYVEVGKARVFADIKEVRRAFGIARRGNKAATFSEYEVVEFEVKAVVTTGADYFMDATKPVPKSRKKKVLTPAATP